MSDGLSKCCSQGKIKANSKEQIMAVIMPVRHTKASEGLLGNVSVAG